MLKHKKYLLYYLDWDWKEQPNWDHVGSAVYNITKHQQFPAFLEFETGGDDYAVFIYAQSEELHTLICDIDRLGDFLDAEFEEVC